MNNIFLKNLFFITANLRFESQPSQSTIDESTPFDIEAQVRGRTVKHLVQRFLFVRLEN